MSDRARARILRGPLVREIGRFGAPLALGMALQNAFNLLDAYLIARLPAGEAEAAIGALGICDQIAAVGAIVAYGVSTAAASLVGQRLGAKNKREAALLAWQSIWLVLGITLAFFVVGIWGAEPLVEDVIGAKGAVAHIATRYLRVLIGGGGTLFFLLHAASLLRALGSAKTPAALLVCGNALNLVLAVAWIFGEGPYPSGFGWMETVTRVLPAAKLGMVGAAWATLAARTAVLVPMIGVLFWRFRDLLVYASEARPNRALMSTVFRLAWPSSAQLVVRILALLILSSIVARFFTTETDQTAQTALGVVFRVDTIAIFVAMGWGSAAQTFVSQGLGASRVARAKKSGWVSSGFNLMTSVALCIVLVFFAKSIVGLFAPDGAAADIALDYLKVVAPAYLPLGVGIVLAHAMTGAGATRLALVVDSIAVLGFQLPVSLLMVGAVGTGLLGLFGCVSATHVLSCALYVWLYARGIWLDAYPVRERPARASGAPR